MATSTPQPTNATLSKNPELEEHKFIVVPEATKRFSTLSTSRNGTVPDLPPPPLDEGPSPFVQDGVARKHLQAVNITYLDGTKHIFYVDKKADGETLFDMVAFQLKLSEKDYFGLFFWDNSSTMISKQLNGIKWNFFLAVKFYPTQPSQLAEDLTRYLLFQQLRQDIHSEKLPVSFDSQSKLGSYAAQAEFGDFEDSADYMTYLKRSKISQNITETLLEHVKELHKQNK